MVSYLSVPESIDEAVVLLPFYQRFVVPQSVVPFDEICSDCFSSIIFNPSARRILSNNEKVVAIARSSLTCQFTADHTRLLFLSVVLPLTYFASDILSDPQIPALWDIGLIEVEISIKSRCEKTGLKCSKWKTSFFSSYDANPLGSCL